MQQITNGQRPATKQRDTDIIISRQTQNNIRNLKISNPYTKATQNNKQNKDKYGQSIQHNKKRMQRKEKIKNKHKQTHKSPTTIQLSRELQNNTQKYKQMSKKRLPNSAWKPPFLTRWPSKWLCPRSKQVRPMSKTSNLPPEPRTNFPINWRGGTSTKAQPSTIRRPTGSACGMGIRNRQPIQIESLPLPLPTGAPGEVGGVARQKRRLRQASHVKTAFFSKKKRLRPAETHKVEKLYLNYAKINSVLKKIQMLVKISYVYLGWFLHRVQYLNKYINLIDS